MRLMDSRWVFDVVEDPSAWWSAITRRWVPRGIRTGEELESYAARCARAQFVRLPPRPLSQRQREWLVKAKIQDKKGIRTDQQRAALMAQIKSVKAKIKDKGGILTDQQHAAKAKILDKDVIPADQQCAAKAKIQDKAGIRTDQQRMLTWS